MLPDAKLQRNGRLRSADNEAADSQRAPRVLEYHLADLRRSGISDEQIARCGFYSESDPHEIARLLNWNGSAQTLGEALVIPFSHADEYCRLKPTTPRQRDGNTVKYESPKGKPNRAYLPPNTHERLTDPTVPLIITEGEKKAAKADQEGFPCIGLVGVYGWHARRERDVDGKPIGPRNLIPDLAAVNWIGRTVFVAFDSDAADNVKIRLAELQLAQTLNKHGADVRIVRLPPGENGAKVGIDDFLVAHSPDAFKALLEEAVEPASLTSGTANGAEDDRVEVILRTEEHRVISETISALGARDSGLYQRGGHLVHVVRDSAPKSRIKRSEGAPRISLVTVPNLRTRITRVAKLILVDHSKDDPTITPCHPPQWLAPGVKSTQCWPSIPHLEGVTEAPVLRPDGTVFQSAGYDPESCILYEPNASYPLVSDSPTKADVERAVAALLEVVADFPFEKSEHCSAWVASLLTLVARYAFEGSAPLFFVFANIRGAGKGLLLDCAAIIALGREFARTPYTRKVEEMRKSIMAIAMAGERGVMFDNIDESFGDPVLDGALTATEWEDRILGGSELGRFPLRATWFATGNNVMIKGDTARRICEIRLQSVDENPEMREGFRHTDLLAWVRSNRGSLLTAALTIQSAYVKAGRPDQKLKPWGSYEGWSNLVRSAVVWAGLPDPGQTRQELAARSDTDAAALRAMIMAWPEIDPNGAGITLADLRRKLESNPSGFLGFRAALAEFCTARTGLLPTPKELGVRLRKFARRNVTGSCFDSRSGHGNVAAWFIRRMDGQVAADGGDGGDGGDAAAPPSTHERTQACDCESAAEETSPPSPPSPPAKNLPELTEADGVEEIIL